MEYLQIMSSAEDQLKKQKLFEVTSDSEVKLSSDDLKHPNGITPFIFEGASRGAGDLTLQIKRDGNIIAESSVRLDLHGISWFYDRYVTTSAGSSSWQTTVSYDTMNSKHAEYQPETEEYLLFVHGWNVSDVLKERWAETVFKRLWWQGYKGGVGLFRWPCAEWDGLAAENILQDSKNFNDSEYSAWQSASVLKEILINLKVQGKKLGVLAHSQGNVVVGEAVRLFDGNDKIIDTYIATQAAISANVYDGGSKLKKAEQAFGKVMGLEFFDSIPLLHNFYKSLYYSITTPDVYSNFSSDTVNAPMGPYLSDNISKIGRMINFYNADDYALSYWRWPLCNVLKPANEPEVAGYTFDYEGNKDFYQENNGDKFFYEPQGIEARLTISSGSPQSDKYKIFAYIAESRVKALGTQIIGTIPSRSNINLENYGFDSKHYSHSKQFRSNIVSERNYWQKVLRLNKFHHVE